MKTFTCLLFYCAGRCEALALFGGESLQCWFEQSKNYACHSEDQVFYLQEFRVVESLRETLGLPWLQDLTFETLNSMAVNADIEAEVLSTIPQSYDDFIRRYENEFPLHAALALRKTSWGIRRGPSSRQIEMIFDRHPLKNTAALINQKDSAGWYLLEYLTDQRDTLGISKDLGDHKIIEMILKNVNPAEIKFDCTEGYHSPIPDSSKRFFIPENLSLETDLLFARKTSHQELQQRITRHFDHVQESRLPDNFSNSHWVDQSSPYAGDYNFLKREFDWRKKHLFGWRSQSVEKTVHHGRLQILAVALRVAAENGMLPNMFDAVPVRDSKHLDLASDVKESKHLDFASKFVDGQRAHFAVYKYDFFSNWTPFEIGDEELPDHSSEYFDLLGLMGITNERLDSLWETIKVFHFGGLGREENRFCMGDIGVYFSANVIEQLHPDLISLLKYLHRLFSELLSLDESGAPMYTTPFSKHLRNLLAKKTLAKTPFDKLLLRIESFVPVDPRLYDVDAIWRAVPRSLQYMVGMSYQFEIDRTTERDGIVYYQISFGPYTGEFRFSQLSEFASKTCTTGFPWSTDVGGYFGKLGYIVEKRRAALVVWMNRHLSRDHRVALAKIVKKGD